MKSFNHMIENCLDTCRIFREMFEDKNVHDKKRIWDHCYFADKCRGTVVSICNTKYIIRKENPVVFHNVLNYDYHFIITEVAEVSCLGGKKKKYINFSVPIKREVKRNGKKEK